MCLCSSLTSFCSFWYSDCMIFSTFFSESRSPFILINCYFSFSYSTETWCNLCLSWFIFSVELCLRPFTLLTSDFLNDAIRSIYFYFSASSLEVNWSLSLAATSWVLTTLFSFFNFWTSSPADFYEFSSCSDLDSIFLMVSLADLTSSWYLCYKPWFSCLNVSSWD